MAPAPHPRTRFFRTPAEFRRWLARNHDAATELWVGFHKRHTSRPSLTWPQSVDQALCFGWIDGIRKRIDEDRYQIRFTPRRANSIWSAVNLARMTELIEQGLVEPAGQRAFAARRAERSGIYSYENRPERLPRAEEAVFKRDRAAWAFFGSQPPWYRRAAIWWIVSAKRDTTKAKRLTTLIACSREKRSIPQLDRTRG